MDLETTTDEDTHRQRARRAINAARRGHLPKPRSNSALVQSNSLSSTPEKVFETARENSIEVYDDKFGRNSILTRSARMRKFKFYQYRPIEETSPKTPTSIPATNHGTTNGDPSTDVLKPNQSVMQASRGSLSSPSPAVMMPREDILEGKVGLVTEQSQEVSELDKQISELEKRIANLNQNSGNSNANKLDEIFELVNKKNDLLRRQMQLNIIDQERALEKANEELTKELRSLMSIDDSKKTHEQLRRQKYLYDQSLALVNKRNELVLHMDVQEKAIEDDNALKARLKSVISDASTRNRLNGQDQNCCIQ